MKSVLLFGGGKETVYNLYNSKNIELLLYFNYGQKSSKQEIKLLRYYSKKFNIPNRVISLKNILHIPYGIKTGQAGGSSNVIMRNTIFTGIAINIAKSSGCSNVIIGTVKAHKSIKYQNDGFQHWLKDISSIAYKTEGVTLISPSSKKSFDEICKFLVEKADLNHIWLCENDKDHNCGRCNKCKTFIQESHNFPNAEKLRKIIYGN